MKIEDLNLDVRTYNAVKRAGCTTVEELRQRMADDPDELRRNTGSSTFDRIEEMLAGMHESQAAVVASENYTRAVSLTRSIIANAQAAQQSLYEVCKGLKEMRDGKLYKELGYQNFEDYTENEVGIKKVQAYKYVAIATNLTSDFVHSSEQIGTTKLALLAKLDEPTRQEVTETVDVESVTVKELKAQITALTAERDENEHAAALLSEELDSAKESLASKDKQFKEAMESKDRQLQSTHKQWVDSQNEVAKLTSKNYDLEEQLKNLESRPVEVAVSEEEAKEIERLKKELEDEQLRVMMVEKSAESKARLAAESVREEYERKLAEQDTAADTKDVFKAYLANAADALTRLLTYLESIRDDKNLPLYVSKVDGIVEMTQTRRNAL